MHPDFQAIIDGKVPKVDPPNKSWFVHTEVDTEGPEELPFRATRDKPFYLVKLPAKIRNMYIIDGKTFIELENNELWILDKDFTNNG